MFDGLNVPPRFPAGFYMHRRLAESRPSQRQTGRWIRLPDRRHKRHGIVVLEFILWAPVFVILLLAVIEFSLIWANLQQVKAASRAGATVAAELATANLSSGNPNNNITLVYNAVAKVLSSSGIAPCEVILEYNPTCGGITPGKLTSGTCPNCSAPATTLPSNTLIPGGTVRVTVCVDVDQMTPNLLATFGFSVTGRTARESMLLPYENCQ